MMDETMEQSSGKESQTDTLKSANNEIEITNMREEGMTAIKINDNELMAHKGMASEQQQQTSNCKTLKRCLSVPNIGRGGGGGIGQCGSGSSMTLRSAAAASALKRAIQAQHEAAIAMPASTTTTTVTATQQLDTPKKCHYSALDNNNIHIAIPRSNPTSREVSPAPMFNIFAPRARRYSASFSPSGAGAVAGSGANNAPLYLTPRVSQLRQEECADVNTREVNHEREVHSAIQMSQSWEDLTLVAENWSCKSDELSNPLQVALPAVAAVASCSSPSPTNNRPGNMRLPYGLSPSPTRRTFATRRSMSPIAMRPSQLGVKRKFDLDEQNSGHTNWSVYSPPPLKKIFTESRGSSPIGQSSSVCPSPDSGTYEGRITPKLSKLCTTNTNAMISNAGNSNCSSPSSNSSLGNNLNLGLIAKSSFTTSSSSTSSTSGVGSNEAMCSMESPMDDGMSISDSAVTTSSSAGSTPAPVVGDMQDDGTMMDDTKSETSSIGGYSSVSIESSSSNTFLNRFNSDSEFGSSSMTSGLVPKHFFINKLHGISGAKKYIVNHDHSDSNLSVSSTTTTMSGTNDLLENTVPPTIMVNNKI